MTDMITLEQKIKFVEGLLIAERRYERSRNPILKAIAADLRARLSGAPSRARVALWKKLETVKRTKVKTQQYDDGQMISLAHEIVGQWPVVDQALERFGAEIEKGEAHVDQG